MDNEMTMTLSRGLRVLPQDKRDIKLGAIVSLPKLSALPDSFDLGEHRVRDQIADGLDDFCSAYMTTGMSEYQEGVELDPGYSFAASKDITGDPAEWGQDLRAAFKSHVKHGALAVEDALPVKTLTPDQKRYFENYPNQLRREAVKHAKKTFVAVTGKYDAFDNIRATLWHFKNERRAVGTGVEFGWPLEQYVLDDRPEGGYGHAMYIKGWDHDKLEYVNSAGKDAGKNGTHLVSRSVVNFYAKIYGAFTFIDMPTEEARARQDDVLGRIGRIFISLFNPAYV